MKRSVFIIGLALGSMFFMWVNVQAQCPNLNFSYGNFTHWQGYIGSCSGGNININESPIVPGRHTIMDKVYLESVGQLQDEICNLIPKVPLIERPKRYINAPSEYYRYSARLGNSNTGSDMEALEYTMTIDATNSLLLVHFAWIMENPPNHGVIEQPKFSMIIKDANGKTMPGIPCSYIDFIADQGLTNLVCRSTVGGGLVARNWTTVGFSLERFIGQTIKIYFETRDCTQGAHYGYAYILADCRSMKIDLQYCEHDGAAKMEAPDGFVNYRWTRSSDKLWVKEGKNMRKISEPDPYNNEVFTCQMSSELGTQCDATVKVVIQKTLINVDFLYGIKDANGHVPIFDYPHNANSWYDTCNRTVTFVDISRVYNSGKVDILWEIFHPSDSKNPIIQRYSDSLFTYIFPDPKDNQPVTYRVRQTVYTEDDCVDTASLKITIYPSPKVKIEGEDQICEKLGIGQWLKAETIRSKFINHQWNWTDTNGILQTAKGDSIKIYAQATYMLISEDSTGCFARDTLKVTALKPILENLRITDVDCYGEATGRFQHGRISGGQAPYILFYWTFPNENGNYDTMPANPNYALFHNLKAGVYKFYAIDFMNCSIEGSIEIKQPELLKITGTQTPTTCGLNNGKLKISASGGVSPYKFKIEKENGTQVSSSNTAENLSSETYTIIVTDNNGCTAFDKIEVRANPVPHIIVDTVISETCEQKNGYIRVRAVNAHGIPKFTWTPDNQQNTTNMIGNLAKGIYKVELIDENGCYANTTIEVGLYPSPSIIVEKTPETCGRKDGTITLIVNNADPNSLKYTWNKMRDTIPNLTELKAGTYKVIIEDAHCVVEKTIVIEHVNGPVANFEANSYNVPNNTVFTLTDISQGKIYTWDWNMGDENTQTGKIVYYAYPKSGYYRVLLEVTDENGCIDTISKIIHIYEKLNVFIPNIFSPNKDEINERWGPKMVEYSKDGYQLSIFDRWGQQIFHTTNTEETWDGTINGKYAAPNTVYSYRIIVQDFTGQRHEYIGHVTILK